MGFLGGIPAGESPVDVGMVERWSSTSWDEFEDDELDLVDDGRGCSDI